MHEDSKCNSWLSYGFGLISYLNCEAIEQNRSWRGKFFVGRSMATINAPCFCIADFVLFSANR